MFDWASASLTTIGSGLVLGLRFVIWCQSLVETERTGRWWRDWGNAVTKAGHTHKVKVVLMFSIVVAYCTIVPLGTCGVCICIFCPEVGARLTVETNINSRLYRALTYTSQCTGDHICFLYLTVPEDPAHFVFINAQTSKVMGALTVKYGMSPENLNKHLQMRRFRLEGLEPLGERDVHSVLLTSLQSNTRYFFQIYLGAAPKTLIQSFRTCPDAADTKIPVSIVLGGDAAANTVSYLMAEEVGRLSPHLVAIGGDVVYDNAILNCYQSWDRFLYMVQTKLVTSEGDMIPIILGIGNHDVGVNPLSERKVEISERGPMIFAMFPQHFARDSEGEVIYAVPEISERRSYAYYEFGNALLLALDSGNVSPYSGLQATWLNSTLSSHRNTAFKFAIYHEPIYGSMMRPDFDVLAIVQAHEHWVPLFDSYNLTIAFENHVHALKRTIPMKHSTYHPQGTVYVGDGQWGVPYFEEYKLDREEEYFVVKTTHNHAWFVQMKDRVADVSACGYDSQVLDQFRVSV